MANRAQSGAERRIDPQSPPYAELRDLMREAFNPQTLYRIYQNPTFAELRYRFSPNDDLDNMIDEVFDICRTRLRWEELLDHVAKDYPEQYAVFAAAQGWEKAKATSARKSDETQPPLPMRGEVEIHVADRVGDGYRIHLRSTAVGDAEATLIPPWTKEEQRAILFALEQQGALLDSVVAGDIRPTDENSLVPIGRTLFNSLLTGNVHTRYAVAAGAAQQGIRVRLRIDPPEMQALPWELLYDDERHHFLALTGNSLITRYLPVASGRPPLAVDPPLKILLLTASPKGYISLNVDAEVEGILSTLQEMRDARQVQVEVVAHADLAAFYDKLVDFHPHVVHFIGHGQADAQGGYLVLEKPDGTAYRLTGPKLAGLVEGTPVRVAVLNACLTARGAAMEVEDFYHLRHALLGLGPALIGIGLGAVVAMQFSMRDLSARVFAEKFYRSLARLEPIDEAVWQGRKWLMAQFDPEQRDWATPVLFLRSADGVIFQRS